MINYLVLFFLLFHYDQALSKNWQTSIIKNQSDVKEKLKECDIGDKILVKYDIKVNTDDLILKICNLKYTVIHKDEVKTIYKRDSGLSIICIYEPSFD